MVKTLDIEEFLSELKSEFLIDVRAPVEFKKGHIPGSVNIPLFDDLERAEIGTLYKQHGKDEAVMRGFEIVSPKMTDWIREVKRGEASKKVFIYCFRGGMRSNSFAWLLSTAGFDAHVLCGGFKKYRQYVLKQFELPYQLVILSGATGSGKTEVLRVLEKEVPVVDLERIAHHKGSAFGKIGELPQQPQQMFETELAGELLRWGNAIPLLLEDESMAIGLNKIPYPFWQGMKKAPIIKMMVPFEARVARLVRDYGAASEMELKTAIQAISSQLGPNLTRQCFDYLTERLLADLARSLLVYYDKTYQYNYTKQKNAFIYEVKMVDGDAVANAQKIKEVYQGICKTLN